MKKSSCLWLHAFPIKSLCKSCSNRILFCLFWHFHARYLCFLPLKPTQLCFGVTYKPHVKCHIWCILVFCGFFLSCSSILLHCIFCLLSGTLLDTKLREMYTKQSKKLVMRSARCVLIDEPNFWCFFVCSRTRAPHRRAGEWGGVAKVLSAKCFFPIEHIDAWQYFIGSTARMTPYIFSNGPPTKPLIFHATQIMATHY